MRLCYEALQHTGFWRQAGISIPHMDWPRMRAETISAPTWVHFGAGNLFRSLITPLQQQLLEQGAVKTGIIAVDTSRINMAERIYQPFDDMSILVTLYPDGSTRAEAVASIARTLRSSSSLTPDMAALHSMFRAPSLQLVSLTITEKGYALTDLHGGFLPSVQADLRSGPGCCRHTISNLVSLLLTRFQAGGAPVAIVSLDNCSRNGEKLQASVLTLAEQWAMLGAVPAAFLRWLKDQHTVSFPWTMADKITPAPSSAVSALLMDAGIAGMSLVSTGSGNAAPFVNAEPSQYLVMEDAFPNGRPPLERAGVYMVDRATVGKVERMKVTACLNPLHTALAVYGCLLRYPSIAAEMQDPELKALVEQIGYGEALPVVESPGILEPGAFIQEVVEQRFPNPFIPDTPQRIATDTSLKIPIRFGEIIKSYVSRPDLNPDSLTGIPLAIAGWFRYLLAVDDTGAPMPCSSDPQLSALQEQLAAVTLGSPEGLEKAIPPLLSSSHLFGSDLMAAGLGNKITAMAQELTAGPGAVRATLKKYLGRSNF